MSAILKSLIGVLPVLVVVPPLMNLFQTLQSGQQLDIMQLINTILPAVVMGTLLPAVFEGLE